MNRKEKIELIATIILVLIFIALLAAFSQSVKNKGLASKRISPKILSSRSFRYDPRRNQGMPFILDKKFGGITGINRDPFTFSLTDEKTAAPLVTDLSLKGIIWKPGNPSAVINDRILKEGETIGDFRVALISPESVILENELMKLELKLNR